MNSQEIYIYGGRYAVFRGQLWRMIHETLQNNSYCTTQSFSVFTGITVLQDYGCIIISGLTPVVGRHPKRWRAVARAAAKEATKPQ